MKTFTHTGLGTSAIAICFVALITRRDGVTFPITAAAQDVTIVGDANTYLAVNADFGDLPYSAQSRADPTEIAVPLDETSGPFKPSEIALGKFRAADVRISRADVTGATTKDWLLTGQIGDIKMSPDRKSATLEIRRDTRKARAVVIRPFGSLCRASVFDYIDPATPGLCKLPGKVADVARNHDYVAGDWVRVRTGVGGIPTDYANRIYQVTADGTTAVIAVEAWMRTVTVTALNSALEFTVSATGDARTVNDWFKLGRYAINGIYDPSYPIRGWIAATRRVQTWFPITGLVQLGDVVDLLPGCDLIKSTCFTKFANVANRRAED
jgi:hypothetical protein